MKLPFAGRQRKNFGLPLLASIAIHLLVLLLIGSWFSSQTGDVAVTIVELQPARIAPAQDVRTKTVPREKVQQVTARQPRTPPEATIQQPEPRTPEPEEELPIAKNPSRESSNVSSDETIIEETPPPDQEVVRQKHVNYLNEIMALIDAHKNYPLMARKLGQEGTVQVLFSIASSGELLDYSIHQSSGYRSLDRAAIRAIADVGRFPPVPALLGAYPSFSVAIVFTLQ